MEHAKAGGVGLGGLLLVLFIGLVLGTDYRVDTPSEVTYMSPWQEGP